MSVRPPFSHSPRRTETGLVSGTDEEAMRRTEAANKALLDRLETPN